MTIDRVDIYDVLSGNTLGSIKADKRAYALSVLAYDGKATLFVVQTSHQGQTLVSLNLETGNQTWEVSIPNISYSPALYNDTLYVASGASGEILALDAVTGRVLWKSDVKDYPLQTPVEFHGKVYVRCEYSGRIYVIDSTNGQVLGSLYTLVYGLLGQDHPYALRPTVTDEVLVIPSGDRLYGYTSKSSP